MILYRTQYRYNTIQLSAQLEATVLGVLGAGEVELELLYHVLAPDMSAMLTIF